MASNSDWTPLPQRKTTIRKQNRENQTKVLNQLKEMFGSTFDSDIIMSVVQCCNWKLEPSLDALINLSSNSNATNPSNSAFVQNQTPVYEPWQADEFPSAAAGAEPPVENAYDDAPPVDHEPDKLSQKIETASLCGLKVQYRPRGMENNSDDDADVVIEEETNDERARSPEPAGVNVCQFLSAPTQCPPRNTFPKVSYVSSASPPCTPQHSVITTAARIEESINSGYKILVLMRGPPGCGKSHTARSILANTIGGHYAAHIFSTDDYFMKRCIYTFDPSKLQEAHTYNQCRVRDALAAGFSPVFVDNTNTQTWEMKPYAVMAVQNGYIVETLEPNTSWFRNARELEYRNTHKVPRQKIQAMLDRYESNISGQRLLHMLSIHYEARNQPPQMRNKPAFGQSIHIERLQPNTQRRVRKPKVTKDEVEPVRLIDNEALNTIAEEYANLEISENKNNGNNICKLSNASWTEGSSYKEESPLKLLQLGAIGSERRSASSSSIKSEKTPAHDSEPDTEDSRALSQCWDFTLLLNGVQIHSKHEFDDAIQMPATVSDAFDQINHIGVSNDTEVSRRNSESKDLSQPSSDSDNSSMERISDEDVLQYEMCSSAEDVSPIANSPEKQPTTSGIGSIFSFIKNSLLSNEADKSAKVSNTETTNKVNENSPHVQSGDVSNNSAATQSETDEILCNDNDDVFVDTVIEELLDACSDFQLVEGTDITEIRQESEPQCADVTEKTFIEQMKNLQTLPTFEEDNKVSKELIDQAFSNKNILSEQFKSMSRPASSDSSEKIDLISWLDVPSQENSCIFIQDEPDEVTVNKSNVCNRETYTDPYDFNVAYVGGTDDYKVLDAVNRNINEGYQHSFYDDQLPPQKLMLHKGTMTNETSVFYEEQLFKFEMTDSSEDRFSELVALFPNMTPEFLRDVYENLCKRDFDWAVDFFSKLHEEATSPEELEALASQHIAYTAEIADEASGGASRQQQPRRNTAAKCNRRVYRENSELQRELESMFVMNEESYPAHTLRVKRWKNREFDEPEDEQLYELQDETIVSSEAKKPTRLDHPAVEDEEPTESEDSVEDEPEEETMELNLGYEFIRALESEFGHADFQMPHGLFPVIQIRRSMAQELHALWIESMQRQLWVMQEQLDAGIARDAEYARTLEAEEARAVEQPQIPNLREIMDMELALATYNNDFKQKFKRETSKDMALRVMRQTLFQMFPDCDRDMVIEILEAHGRNFDETVKVIEENGFTKSTETMGAALTKRKHLIDELESTYRTSKHNELSTAEKDDEASDGHDTYQGLSYAEVLNIAHDSRDEARRQFGLGNTNYQKAADAMRHKNHEVAAYYSDVAKLHMRKMELANSEAYSAYLAAQGHVGENEDTLDLHFLHVAEAMLALDNFIDRQLEMMTKGQRKNIFIITGRGARSIKGQSRIKPAIIRKLNIREIRFSEVNPGMLKVHLKKK